MEEKLREFKNRKRREHIKHKAYHLFGRVMEKITLNQSSSECEESVNSPLLGSQSPTFKVQSDDELSIASSNLSADFSCTSWSSFTVITYFLYALLWLTTYLIAIQLEFGYVYLIVSALLFIYLNTRTGPKKEGEISAYSVFNPNCESIDGTLKAEQFEREFNLIKHVTASPNQ